MDLNGVKILIDGDTLQGKYTRGTKTYGINLIKAYKSLGAEPSVLFFLNTQSGDTGISFKKMNLWSHLKYGFPLLIKNIIGGSGYTSLTDIPKDNDIQGDLSFIKDVNVYASPGSNWIAKRFRSLGLELTLAPRPKVDIWHMTNYTPIKIKDALRVATIHDVNPLRYPISSNPLDYPATSIIERRKYRNRVIDAIKDCSLILSVSEHTKKDMIELFDVDPDKIFVTYQPAFFEDKVIAEDIIKDRLKSLDLSYGKYILFVGDIEPKKNIKRLIEAYLSLSTDIPLVLAGKNGWGWALQLAQLDNESNKKRVRVLGYISENDKHILYKGAMFFVFPSLWEGFGIPPIEAMSLGTAVLTSSICSLPEICSDAALYLDPYDVKDIGEKINIMINDSELRQKLITSGYERSKFFSMDNYIKRLKAAYDRI